MAGQQLVRERLSFGILFAFRFRVFGVAFLFCNFFELSISLASNLVCQLPAGWERERRRGARATQKRSELKPRPWEGTKGSGGGGGKIPESIRERSRLSAHKENHSRYFRGRASLILTDTHAADEDDENAGFGADSHRQR